MILGEVNRLFQVESQSSQLLSCNTTFKLGDFYVSPLLFRNFFLKGNPILQAMFMIHERKPKSTHDELMKIVAHKLPHRSQTVSMVTDEEKGLHQLMRKCADFCAGIISSAPQNKGHGAEIHYLLHQKNEMEYNLQLDEIKKSWSQPFLQYFMSQLSKGQLIVLFFVQLKTQLHIFCSLNRLSMQVAGIWRNTVSKWFNQYSIRRVQFHPETYAKLEGDSY